MTTVGVSTRTKGWRRHGDDNDVDAKKRAADDSETAEDADELDGEDDEDEGIIRSGAASEAENDADADADVDAEQIEQLRRLEPYQQAQTQTQLKQSIEVQRLRGVVRAQLGC